MNIENLIIVRGGGDIATGIIQKLFRAGFPVLVLEDEKPTAIRRNVALCEAVYAEVWTVEDITAVLVRSFPEALARMESGIVPVLVDPGCGVLREVRPMALVDAILAKRNLGTSRSMSDITVALGPGFRAGDDVDIVVETMRGHDLGRLVFSGTAIPNTGIPGVIAGVGKERVIHSPAAGTITTLKNIGDHVEKGTLIATVGETPVYASITGILRGLIRDRFEVWKGMKIADIDPRESEQKNCFTISDKARCVGGSVLEAVLIRKRQLGRGPAWG